MYTYTLMCVCRQIYRYTHMDIHAPCVSAAAETYVLPTIIVTIITIYIYIYIHLYTYKYVCVCEHTSAAFLRSTLFGLVVHVLKETRQAENVLLHLSC